MEISIFLARWLGLYMLAVVFIWLTHKEKIERTFHEMVASNALVGLSGILSLLFGLAIAILHSVWELNWRGLITFLGYLSIFQGFVRLSHPEFVRSLAKKMISKWYFGPLILIIIGSILTYYGFAIR